MAGSERILAEVDRLLALADDRVVRLRLLGSVAVWAHCREHRPLLVRLERQEYRDIDLMGRSQDRRGIGEVFTELGYEPDAALLGSQGYGINRLIFHSRPLQQVKVDVFFDTLRMCHRIELADRLQLDRPTVPLADLLLSKLQIVRLTNNDIKDCTVLVAEHPLPRRRRGVRAAADRLGKPASTASMFGSRRFSAPCRSRSGIAGETSTATTRPQSGAMAKANVPVPAPKSTIVLAAPTPSPVSSAMSSVGSQAALRS